MVVVSDREKKLIPIYTLQVFRFREGNGNPLQYSCMENPRDGGAWWAAVCGIAQSRTRLKQLSSSSVQIQETQRTLETVLQESGVGGPLLQDQGAS